MGQKIVGGMWCDYCKRPVAGQKATSRARNTVVGLTAPITGGLSLAGAKRNKVYCPICGQHVRPATPQDFGAPSPAPPRARPTPERAAQLAQLEAKKRSASSAGGTTRPAGSGAPRKKKGHRKG